MDTTINTDLRVGNNTIEPCSFFWISLFQDNSKIEQFNPDGSENRFQLVKDKMNELAYFNLTDRKGHFFTIDLINGRIGYNYLPLPYLEKTDKQNIRLIFFRRHQMKMSMNGKLKSHNIEYHLGFQWQDFEKRNHKIILKIDNEGSWIIGDN